MPDEGQNFFEFEDFRLDADHLLLFRNSEQLALAPKVVETLVALVRRQGEVLSKDKLMGVVWPDTVVEESNLSQNLYLLRKELGTTESGKPVIETLRRRGYRFNPEICVTQRNDIAGFTKSIGGVKGHTESVSTGNLVIAAAVLTCLLVTGIASIFYHPWGAAMLDPATPRRLPGLIAVLPFRTLGVESERQRLGLGICDALITRLGNNRRVIVRPTSSVRQYVNPNQNVVEIGRMQGVDAVLDGSIQQDGDRFRVTVQLIDSLSGATIWSARFDARSNDTFEIQDSISDRVIAEMSRDLVSDESAAAAR